ncbi:MAG: ribulokinase [Thermoflavifilum sp.]|nr:ribulokinase [Thermoflavifilum sp.]
MNKAQWVFGIDYGTDSVRAVLVDTANGSELATAVFVYPRWRDKLYCDPSAHQYRQHPLDYIEGLESVVRSCVEQVGEKAAQENVVGLGIDTTGSTPVAVNVEGVPLALLPGFEEEPDAMFILWKDHTAVKEAADINAFAATQPVDYLQFVGGVYSSEWFWAKLLHVLRNHVELRPHIYSWVEHCDWMPFLLTGGKDVRMLKRSVCAAGHKALWAEEFGGWPPDSFFAGIDPLLQGFRDRVVGEALTADRPAGRLSREWAERLRLSERVVVSVGAFDAHIGAVGGQIAPYQLSKVMGTSTCDILVAPAADMQGKVVKGICGQVHGSVVPGMIGMEAGQSAFGDTYAWWRDVLLWPLQHVLPGLNHVDADLAKQWASGIRDQLIAVLSEEAQRREAKAHVPIAVDWLNGRRTPFADQELKAALIGLDLGTDAVDIFRAWAEATCFGARSIVECFVSQGVPVKGVIGLGGVARKSPYIMQLMADVLNMPLRIHRAEHTCASGAAMFAATAAGVYPNVELAMQAMGQGFDQEYRPRPDRVAVLDQRYQQFKQLGKFVEQTIHSH